MWSNTGRMNDKKWSKIKNKSKRKWTRRNEYIYHEGNNRTNYVMLTPKIKSSESAVALELISQLRRPGSSNACKCDQQKYASWYIKLYKSNTNEKIKREIKADMTTQHEFIFVCARNSISQLRRHRESYANKFVKGADRKRLKAKTKTTKECK